MGPFGFFFGPYGLPRAARVWGRIAFGHVVVIVGVGVGFSYVFFPLLAKSSSAKVVRLLVLS